MSETYNNTAAHPTEPVTDSAATAAPAQTEPVTSEAAVAAAEADKPLVNGATTEHAREPAAESTEAAIKDEIAPTAVAAVPNEESKKTPKAVEPITEGQLAYKGPGLIKSIVPLKKEFWLSDAPVTPQHLDLFLRGEKPEFSNAIVAWASQTGKGLLFFNKKGETDRKRPQNVIPLYDVDGLKKEGLHEIHFRVHTHQYTLKAATETERDGWYMSLERAVEVGKAEKESIRASEGYKAEIEKLNKPNIVGAGAAAVGVAGAAKPTVDEEKNKPRSTSRGVLDRLRAKKDEAETKREEKQEAKEEKKDEVKAEETAAGVAALDAPAVADRAVGAPVETYHEPAAEAAAVKDSIAAKTEEPVKPTKRGSIFGRVQSSFGGIRSPGKEKEHKDAELKPQVPPKDIAVAETAPQIPEPQAEAAPTQALTTETAEKPAEVTETPTPSKPAPAVKEKLDEAAPKKNTFLSGLPFLNKRDRSVSPSAAMKEAPTKKETPLAPKEDTVAETAPAVTEPAVVEEPSKPAVETAAVIDKPAEKAEEAKPAATAADTTTPNGPRRQSVFGNIGRRASKAFKGFQSPKKENDVPATTAAKTETPVTSEGKAETAPTSEEPLVHGESKPVAQEEQPQATIGDVSGDSVDVGHAQSTPAVTASA